MKLFAITGSCGTGKSTMKDELEKILDPQRYFCADTDEMGFNWWDYAGTDHEFQYKDDCLREAVRRAAGKHLVFVGCTNPDTFLMQNTVPEDIDSTVFIVLLADDEIVRQRLRDRPAERGFTSDEKIRPHIEYNQWFRRNRRKFPLVVDTSAEMPERTAEQIAGFIRKWAEA